MSFLVNPYTYATGCDADAVAFLAAAAITDATMTSAICTLVTSMKANGTWAKCSAIYPMVGGTATTHKFNLKNPLDTNAAFRLSFVGGWTHSSGGALPNGTNAYADTFLIPSTTLSLNSIHGSVYSRTNTDALTVLFGSSFNTSTREFNIFPRFSNLSFFRVNSNGDAGVSTGSDSRGWFCANRISSTQTRNYRNSTQYILNTSSNLIANLSILLSANNNTSFRYFSNREIAFSSFGSGLTDTEAASLYTSVQAFQTTLSRQV
jgi:hypothetical protein